MSDSTKYIRDPIYGFIPVSSDFLKIIDHELFQRLRWISQMSFAQMVFPSAVHTRFEHSLGTFHLAGLAIRSILEFCADSDGSSYLKESKAGTELLSVIESNREDFIKAAQVTALLHDVGHAPFSHTFEMAMDNYDHEVWGYHIAKKILTDASYIDSDWAQWSLHALDKNKPLESLAPHEMILRSLIDGPIDVDKGDYLIRDSYHCGVQYGWYGQDRLWSNLAVIASNMRDKEVLQVGVTEKGAYEAYHLLMARFHMYEAVYEHHTKQKVDSIVATVLHSARSVLAPSLKTHDFKQIVHWTDGYIINTLLSTFNPWIPKLYRRELPVNASKLGEVRIECHPQEKKVFSTKLKKEVWKILDSLDQDKIFFSYLYSPQEPMPVKHLHSIRVFFKGSPVSLYEFLRMNKLFPQFQGSEDPDEPVGQHVLMLKPFSYHENFSSSVVERWKSLEDILEPHF